MSLTAVATAVALTLSPACTWAAGGEGGQASDPVLHAGSGGSAGSGGFGGFNDSNYMSGGGNGGSTTAAGPTAGSSADNGSYDIAPEGQGGAAATGVDNPTMGVLIGRSGSAGESQVAGEGFGGGGGGGANALTGNALSASAFGQYTGGAGGAGGQAYWAAGGGGAGGAGTSFTVDSGYGNSGMSTGGAGGAGGDANSQAGGGGGGGAGVAIHIGGTSGSFNNAGSAVGGAGGAGGGEISPVRFNAAGGGGGEGGSGALLTGNVGSVTNTGLITGGAGGAGGSSGGGVGGVGAPGAGGDGGVGLQVQSAIATTITNSGTISGGQGGVGGANTNGGAAGANGAGGVGVLGANLSILNTGAISGGLGGDGSTRAAAVEFNGGTNTLVLDTGSTLSGRVVVGSAATATLQARAAGMSLDGADVGGATTLDAAAGASLNMTGPVSGNAGLTITGAGTVAMNAAGTYSGGTTIQGGHARIADGQALGTGAVTVTGGGSLTGTADITVSNPSLVVSGDGTIGAATGTTLTVSNLGLQANPNLSIGSAADAGTVVLPAAGTVAMDGTPGSLHVLGGTLTGASLGDLTGSLASTTVDAGAALDYAGQSAAILDLQGGGRVMGATALEVQQGNFAGEIAGTGSLAKTTAGTLVLSGSNSFSGTTTVAAGTLSAGAANALSPNSAHTVSAGATLDLAGYSQRVNGMTNAGTVSLLGSAPGTTLTVTGPWVGNNGELRLGTSLGDSSSASDRLILDGGSAVASGTTRVQITNLNGLGALTSGNGIEVISAVNGATTTAQSTKDAFALAGGHVDAGAYEYRLHAADAAGAGENWYLRSDVPSVPATPPITQAGQAPSGAATPAGTAVVVPTYRAEAPLFAALPQQLRETGLSMVGNLHQRVGDETGTAPRQRQAWGRVISMERDMAQAGTLDAHSEGRLDGFQAGTDLWADAQWRAGVYVGQLDGDMDVNGFARGVRNLAVGSNDLRAQYLGAYATWTSASGIYVDGVLQGGRLRYDVDSISSSVGDGKGSSMLASLEMGRAFALMPGWSLEPQIQLVHQRIDLDDVAIGGALVQQDVDSNWLMRLGMRVKGEISTGAGVLQPYARLNVYRSSGGTDVVRFVGPAAATNLYSSTGGLSTELAVGGTWQLSPALSVYGEVGQMWGSGGSSAEIDGGLNAAIGLKVSW
ncbi:autotransporter outer membrane beta-barrel domain-containing protein [Variovorax dokdonensis]|uniref:Autotransporter outer membrane beta-barrel domain-containing protein n=1 Tax=Variovorax dokdonensis TaxID=344883 RepID=A0ABT7NDG6_9BURK|nr:autotransporter outer membrane beta-barrel domain-containing protein [Variovorax dokdonensis]MDM0045992.1 autotransporter outer membrane beta-barrel domain-containing protein [Variovorax dokdonensis]